MTERDPNPTRGEGDAGSVSGLFDAAIAVPPAEREAWLASHCGEGSSLKRQVQALLQAHEAAGRFLETRDAERTVASGREPASFGASPRAALETIDAFTLTEKLGEGGFGEVYLAEQREPVRRQVAIKIIKPGMGSDEALARFEAERQALALMDHPNIATVLDAGQTQDGRPYFVMEWVRGEPITTYCDRKGLNAKDRLRLLTLVCGAIQHAHHKGVIHRDIKPSNILITEVEGAPIPKVIDFGIAKAFREKITDREVQTRVEQVIGTPAYMSPEQSGMPGYDADTRADVYALGVLLYELLVGSTPFETSDWRTVGFDEIRRRIREDTPPKPSVRLDHLSAKEQTSIADSRQTEASALRRSIAGDLDIIVMKALEKDRQRRYDAPNFLAKDLERFLNNQEIEARPPSVPYRARQFFRRNRLACVAGVFSVLSLLIGFVIAVGALAQALAEKNRADNQTARTQRLIYPTLLEAAHDAIDNGMRARAEELFLSCPESERGWEWAWAQRLLIEPKWLFADPDFEAPIEGLEFSPSDGALHVKLSDGSSWVWDLATETGPQPVASMRSSPSPPIEPTNAVAIFQSGDRTTVAQPDGEIVLYSSRDPQTGIAMEGRVYDVARLAIHPTVERVVVATTSGALYAWDFQGIGVWQEQPAGVAHTALAFSPDGSLIAVGAVDGSISLRRADDGRPLHAMDGHRRAILEIAFDPEGATLASSGEEGVIGLWDSATGRRLGTLLSGATSVTKMAFSRGSTQFAATTGSGAVALWSLDDLRYPTKFVGSTDMIYECATSDAQPIVVTGGRDGSLRVWDRRNGAERARFHPRCAHVYSVDISPDGQWIASRGDDAMLRLWSLDSSEPEWEQAIDPGVRIVRFSPDGRWLASGSLPDEDGASSIGLWNVESRSLEHRLDGHQGEVVDMAWDRDSRRLASVSRAFSRRTEGGIILWDATTGTELQRLRQTGSASVTSVLWGGPQERLYSGHDDGRITYWDLESGAPETTVYAHGAPVGALALTPDGRGLLSGSWYASELRLWEPHSGEPRFAWDSGIAGISDVAFDPHGGLSVCGADGMAYFFPSDDQPASPFSALRSLETAANQLLLEELELLSGGTGEQGFGRAVQDLARNRKRFWESAHAQVDASRPTLGANAYAAASLDAIAVEYFLSQRFEEAGAAIELALELDPTPSRETRLEWVDIALVVDEGFERNLPQPTLRTLSGDYGPWTITVEGSQLRFRDRSLETTWRLLAIEPHRFLVDGDESVQILFDTPEPGVQAAAMEILRFQGGRERRERTRILP